MFIFLFTVAKQNLLKLLRNLNLNNKLIIIIIIMNKNKNKYNEKEEMFYSKI